MLTVHQNFSLKNLNTFGVEALARWFVEVDSETDLAKLFSNRQWLDTNRLILGGGSNMLFTHDFEGIVIRMNIRGITHVQHGDELFVSSGAGEVWNDLVQYCVNRNFAGLENLSLIPGSVGASPIQNIGAYGVELKNVFHSCRAFNIQTHQFREFSKDECRFGYRDSVFKNELRGQYIITQVTFALQQQADLILEYGAIRDELQRRGIGHPGIKDVSDVVSAIRVSKLPDPSTIGNAGSFFKNPVIPLAEFQKLQAGFPDVVHYPAGEGFVKLAAGWLIEQCGWKGKRVGNTGTWKNQALVLVNHGGATGTEVYAFSEEIIKSVQKLFNILLEREVNVI